MADLLAMAGCETIKIGMQSVDPRTLREVLHRTGSVEDLKRTARLIEERGMNLIIEHIIGFPGEGVEQQKLAANVYAEIRARKFISFWLVYYPGTEITGISKQMGVLDEEEANAIEAGDPAVKYSYMFPGNRADVDTQQLSQYQTLLDLLPFFPIWLRKFLVRWGVVRFLPFHNILHQSLIVLNALRSRDGEDLNKVWYAISSKNVP